MDLVRLLSRGARSNQKSVQQQDIPSAQAAPPKLRESLPQGKKRKRGEVDPGQRIDSSRNAPRNAPEDEDGSINTQTRDIAQRQALLKQHKIKVVHLDSSQSRPRAANGQAKPSKGSQHFPDPCLTIAEVAGRYDLPLWLSNSLRNEGYKDATEVQMAALPLLLESNKDRRYPESDGEEMRDIDLLTVAPTGSGKTLAFLIPVLAKIARSADDSSKAGTTPQALILAPTRELVEQIVSVGRRLTHKSSIRIKRYQKRTSLAKTDESNMKQPAILVSTPGMLHSALARDELQRDALASVTYLILDEADVLLDPLFREQTTTIWTSLPNPDLKVSLWSATMGSNIEDLARTTIEERRLALEEEGMSPQKPSLLRLVIGLKDSAVPNVQHKLIYAATEQGKLLGLRQLLHPGTTTTETGPVLRPPFIVFTQTIERAVALHSELLYDIPAEAGGSSRIAVLHSDLSDSARDAVMARFRRAELWVLITTDLLSRGIDFRGVNGVVNYDIPSSSAAYVHRIGRTGRAGRTGGVAVTLYTEEDIPYLKHVANVIAVAQRNGNGQDAGIQQWLLDALPSLGKNDKKKLKKHGVEARTARGMANDPRGARKAKISTKAGFVRREENRKKGAIEASRRRVQAATNDNDESDFEDLDE